MATHPPSKYDVSQIIKRVYDEDNGRLRTDATISGDVIISDLNIDQATDSIRIGDGTNLITATQDGAKTGLDVNVLNDIELTISAASGDSILISDGTNNLHVNSNGSINVEANDLDIRHLSDITDRVSIGDGTNVAAITSAGELKVQDENVQSELQNIASILSGTGRSLGIGTEDGTVTGTPRVFVNNLRQQILSSQDRIQNITYEDFGTVNQRIIQIDYSSLTIGMYIARKTISYTLVGNKYRIDSINWAII